MGRLGVPELLVIFAIVVVLFGGSRVPQLGAALGQAIRNFKKGFNGEDIPADQANPPAAQQQPTRRE